MRKRGIIISSAVLLVFGMAALSFAKTDGNQGANGNSSGKNTGNSAQTTESPVKNANQNQEKNQVQNENKSKNQGTAATGENAQMNQEQEKSKEKNKTNTGQANAETHRSAVAGFVKSLLEVAKNEENGEANGIGSQVRNVAMQQNQGEATTITAMEQVQTRSKIKTFLFGSDYKNLGALRSEMVQTRNRIRQLTELVDKAENEETKQTLQEQIQQLEQEQTKINSFITENESKISLFGWLAKMFQ
ncbi:MAG: hypothetical protein Q8L09_03540 [Candidatus Moranbacteria bacterium]|nr:hypothetical protein [Candidatus Moranbacteria bacterium]